jgi:hypothetical protein
MFKIAWIDSPAWLYVWEGTKVTAFFLYLTLVAVVGVLDVIMFLFLFVNGLSAPHAR